MKVTVARGRTVYAQHPTLRTVAVNATGETVEIPATVPYGPGEEIEIHSDEVARLLDAGFIVDPTDRITP